ncbi:GGDEF domain-containing protein [Rhodocyclus purpureus]|uniref:GGDEF domain-containing protein n=1 Tax=Rhodocyclus purpureus TaxID=1067 RepID=UPI0019139B3C|nr:GGDEF domain-containing protein [Rhodocyclus purpureus]MBK5914765.1 hypothetical protein [Rhodocyclus purpureus]
MRFLRHLFRCQRSAWLGFILACASLATLAGAPSLAAQTLDQAVLSSPSGERQVSLPNLLQPDDFAPAGGRVRYTLQIELPAPPAEPLGIYVSKVSLSGQLALNGQPLGACEPGPLEELRCLHRPYLFVPPVGLWQAGTNTIEVEVFANQRQMNGLAPVQVGSAQELDRGPYLRDRLLRVELIRALTWVSLCLGLLALAVAAILRTENVFLWFGLCSIVNALSNLNVLVSTPLVGFELFSWFIFSSRMVSVPLLLLTLLVFFERAGVAVRRGLVGYALLMPLIVWLGGNDRWLVVLLYVPLMALALAMVPAVIYWSWRSRQTVHAWVTLNYALLMLASVLDFLRLNGTGSFTGVYWITYAYTGLILLFGVMLMSRLASALISERELTAKLDLEVARQTADLKEANQRLAELSTTDPLTGIANRRQFDQTLAVEWKRAQRQQQPLSLLMLDVDMFKAYNDHYGHQAGDECLRAIAAALRSCCQRSGDLLARYGGEEFVLIADADQHGALQFAEKLRSAVEDIKLAHARSPSGQVTASIGLATLVPAPTTTPDTLLRLADEALYQAKADGRNRVRQAAA